MQQMLTNVSTEVESLEIKINHKPSLSFLWHLLPRYSFKLDTKPRNQTIKYPNYPGLFILSSLCLIYMVKFHSIPLSDATMSKWLSIKTRREKTHRGEGHNLKVWNFSGIG